MAQLLHLGISIWYVPSKKTILKFTSLWGAQPQICFKLLDEKRFSSNLSRQHGVYYGHICTSGSMTGVWKAIARILYLQHRIDLLQTYIVVLPSKPISAADCSKDAYSEQTISTLVPKMRTYWASLTSSSNSYFCKLSYCFLEKGLEDVKG